MELAGCVLLLIRCLSAGFFPLISVQPTQGTDLKAPVRVEVKEVKQGLGPSLAQDENMRIYFEVSKIQEQQDEKAQGLHRSIVVVNQGTQAIDLLDPKPTTTIHLRTEDGWPVVPALEKEKLDVLRARSPGTPAAVRHINIASGEEYRMPITVSKVFPIEKRALKDRRPASNDASAGPKLIPLPAGRYTMSVTMVRGDASGSLRFFESPWVEVTLGTKER